MVRPGILATLPLIVPLTGCSILLRCLGSAMVLARLAVSAQTPMFTPAFLHRGEIDRPPLGLRYLEQVPLPDPGTESHSPGNPRLHDRARCWNVRLDSCPPLCTPHTARARADSMRSFRKTSNAQISIAASTTKAVP